MITPFLRQVPGLRAVSKRKKKSAPNAPTHTRPPPIDRIAAQRAQRRHNRDGSQPQQANLASAPIVMGDQGGNIPDEDIQPDNNLEDLPIPNAEDVEEEEEASRRYQGEEQERARVDEREKRQNVPRPIPRVTLTLKSNPARPQPLATANNIVSHRVSLLLVLIVSGITRN